MGRLYNIRIAPTTYVAVHGDVDLFGLHPVGEKPICLRKMTLSQVEIFKDANELILKFRVLRLQPTVTFGGTQYTPQKVNPGDAAASFVSETSSTVATTSGATEVLDSFSWNLRDNGLTRSWDPPACHSVFAGQYLILRMDTTLPSSITFRPSLVIEEF